MAGCYFVLCTWNCTSCFPSAHFSSTTSYLKENLDYQGCNVYAHVQKDLIACVFSLPPELGREITMQFLWPNNTRA